MITDEFSVHKMSFYVEDQGPKKYNTITPLIYINNQYDK